MYEEHCLFCWEKIIPYNVTVSQHDGGGVTCRKGPTFNKLCEYLEVNGDSHSELWQRCKGLPQFSRTQSDDDDDEVNKSDGCVKFLCLNCFELVDKLRKLYQDLEKVKEEIEDSKRYIKGVIFTASSKCGLPSGIHNREKKRRHSTRKNGMSESESSSTFQRFVKKQEQERDFSLVTESNSDPEQLIIEDANANSATTLSPPNKSALGTRNYSQGCGDTLEPIQDAIVKIETIPEENENDGPEEKEPVLDDLVSGSDNHEDVNARDKNAVSNEVQVEPENPENAGTRRKSKRISQIPPQQTKGYVMTVPKVKSPPKRKRLVYGCDKESDPNSPFKYTCRYCQAKFRMAHQYYTHRKSHLPPPSDMKSLDIRNVYAVEKGKKIIVARICSICNHRVNGRGNTTYAFMEHMLSHESFTVDNTIPVYSCNQCDKHFTIELNLDLHRKYNHDWQKILLKCEFCGSVHKTQAEFAGHLESHDSVNRTHSCKNCPMVCTSLDKLLAHMVKHSRSKQLFCPECPQVILTIKDLYKHCGVKHPELKEKLVCPQKDCSKIFLLPTTLRLHLRKTHGLGDKIEDAGEFFCGQCNNGKNYKYKKRLENHMLYVHDNGSRRYKCSHCEGAFLYKSQLTKHVIDKHDRIRYPCPHCPATYSDTPQLNNHLKIHTGEGLLSCPECAKTFPTKNQLIAHAAVHLEKSAENSFVCDICGRVCITEGRLRQHKTIHKEKRFECPHQNCKMMFGRREHLRCHLRTHSEERPFSCPICKKGHRGFKTKGVLIVHLRGHEMSHEEAKQFYQQHLNDLKDKSQ